MKRIILLSENRNGSLATRASMIPIKEIFVSDSGLPKHFVASFYSYCDRDEQKYPIQIEYYPVQVEEILYRHPIVACRDGCVFAAIF